MESISPNRGVGDIDIWQMSQRQCTPLIGNNPSPPVHYLNRRRLLKTNYMKQKITDTITAVAIMAVTLFVLIALNGH